MMLGYRQLEVVLYWMAGRFHLPASSGRPPALPRARWTDFSPPETCGAANRHSSQLHSQGRGARSHCLFPRGCFVFSLALRRSTAPGAGEGRRETLSRRVARVRPQHGGEPYRRTLALLHGAWILASVEGNLG